MEKIVSEAGPAGAGAEDAAVPGVEEEGVGRLMRRHAEPHQPLGATPGPAATVSG